MKVAIYSRKSVFTGKGDSIGNQIELCKEYYYRNYGDDVEFLIYEDEGFSGSNTKRPQFQQLLKDVKAKKFNALICYRLDRISRNVADFSTTLELLQANNISFISIKEQFDTSTPMGRAMIYISSVFAQLERESIAERVKDNMMQLSKTGRWLGGTPPFGFDSTRETYMDENCKEHSLSKLVVNDDEMKIVKLVFEKYLEFTSINRVSKYLIEKGIRGKNGGIMDKSCISNILTNPCYCISNEESFSYLINNGYEVCGNYNGNGFLRYTPKNTNTVIVSVGKHKGVISSQDWIKVQNIIKANKLKAPKQSKTNKALLTGLLKCGKCGANMNIKYGSKYKDNDKAFYYVCSRKIKSKSLCDCKNINGDIVEKIVLDNIKNYNYKDLFNELDTLINTSSKNENTRYNDIQKQIDSYNDKVKRLISKLSLTDDIDISKMIMEQITEYKNKINELNKEKDSELDKSIDVAIDRKSIEETISKLKDFKNTFNFLSHEEKIKLLNDTIEDIVWNDAEMDLKLTFKIDKKK